MLVIAYMVKHLVHTYMVKCKLSYQKRQVQILRPTHGTVEKYYQSGCIYCYPSWDNRGGITNQMDILTL